MKRKRRKKSLKNRIIINGIFRGLLVLFSFLLFCPLIFILIFIIVKGLPAINWQFLTQLPQPPGSEIKGGIVNAILGSLQLILITVCFSVPLGILTGMFLSEYKNHKLASLVRLCVEVLQGIPSIVLGIIIYIWVVSPLKSFSLIAGSFALSLIMLPIIIKTTEETLNLIPLSLKEASLALGVPYYRTLLKVILPTGFSSIISGILLATARASGETAPLLFTAFGNPYLNFNPLKAVSSTPLLIFNYAVSPYQEWQNMAWGASLLLVIFILAFGRVDKFVFFISNFFGNCRKNLR